MPADCVAVEAFHAVTLIKFNWLLNKWVIYHFVFSLGGSGELPVIICHIASYHIWNPQWKCYAVNHYTVSKDNFLLPLGGTTTMTKGQFVCLLTFDMLLWKVKVSQFSIVSVFRLNRSEITTIRLNPQETVKVEGLKMLKISHLYLAPGDFPVLGQENLIQSSFTEIL